MIVSRFFISWLPIDNENQQFLVKSKELKVKSKELRIKSTFGLQ